MSGFRGDDGLAWHPKLLRLPRKDRWTWLELVCYCARYRTQGRVPHNIIEVTPYATKNLMVALVDLGLLEPDGDGWILHDWEDYALSEALTNAERQRRYRNAHRNENRNAEVTDDITESNGERNGASRARAGAAGQARASAGKPERARHRTGSSSSKDPLPPVSIVTVASRWIASPAFDPETFDEDIVLDELGAIERRTRQTFTDQERQELLAAALDRIAEARAA